MRLIAIVGLICWIAPAIAQADHDQMVRIVVRVPSNTSTAESIYLAGSQARTGGWKADGVKLIAEMDGLYSGAIELPIGAALEFKFTRGTWATVEKNADGSDRPNRRAIIDAATKQIDATVERWSGDGRSAELASTVVGNLKLHTIDSRFLKQPRTIRVWLPPDYDANAKDQYGVLYMHDGQNCFDRRTSAFGNEWEIDESLTKLIRDKCIPPIIVVGIDNGLANRINELTYTADAKRGGGQGTAYADFLLTEVKPFIEKTYLVRTGPAHTFIGGSSLGGLASLEIARRHPDTFGGVIAMSPAISWAAESAIVETKKDPGGLSGARIWIDMGTRESIPDPASESSKSQRQQFVQAAKRLDAALSQHHINHRLVVDDQHAEHNEPAWASRFPQAITYILGAN